MLVDGPRARRTVAASLGVLILVAAVFAPLGSIAWSHKYTVEEVEPDDPQLSITLSWTDRITSCYEEDGSCDLHYRLKDNESRIVSNTTYRAALGIDPETKVVNFPEPTNQFYRLQFRPYDNGTARVGLERVSNATALELVSTPSMNYPDGVRTLVEEGEVRTNDELSGYALWTHTKDVIAHDGAYYRQGANSYRGSTVPIVPGLRLVFLTLGAALCYRAGRIT
ncbi:hypothetical protein FK85_12630 [Halorubrum saccharovorum]|uniref:Uncharacterized protein n=1 Tax=Halorubrum saccharovorum TaxID=2248 RepID=A0A081EX51_9EURY|nr:hypothetical protein [Halorubrum saccharovorum]KDS91989.1 hypothetical protein FK85_12630 [Halorubrum saccharovorum]